jgi:hypothetical protein
MRGGTAVMTGGGRGRAQRQPRKPEGIHERSPRVAAGPCRSEVRRTRHYPEYPPQQIGRPEMKPWFVCDGADGAASQRTSEGDASDHETAKAKQTLS